MSRSLRHRLQGRYPAFIASSAAEKNSMFSRFGFFDVQEGRQKMPVDFTP
jgi:hypothetical protein